MHQESRAAREKALCRGLTPAAPARTQGRALPLAPKTITKDQLIICHITTLARSKHALPGSLPPAHD